MTSNNSQNKIPGLGPSAHAVDGTCFGEVDLVVGLADHWVRVPTMWALFGTECVAFTIAASSVETSVAQSVRLAAKLRQADAWHRRAFS